MTRAYSASLQSHVAPAIDVDGFSRHIGRFGEQKMHRLGNVLGRAFALERCVRDDALAGKLVEGFIVGPQDRTRRDGVDELSRQRIISNTPLKREGTPEDIAKAVHFLLAEATYVTGETINVDGGRHVAL